MALRLDFTPSNFTLIQFVLPLRSLRNSEGGSLRLTISMSISPSLSKSPKRIHGCSGTPPRPGRLPDEFFKNAFAQIPKQSARGFIGILRQGSFHLRVNMAGNHEEVWKTIVVQINDACSPTDVSGFDPNARGSRNVIEITLPIVVVKDVGVVQKMRFEKVKMSVQIVIADPDSHARLLHAIFAQRYASQTPFFTKCSISIVHEQETGSGIGGDVDVLPTILIEVGRDHSQAIAWPEPD